MDGWIDGERERERERERYIYTWTILLINNRVDLWRMVFTRVIDCA